MTVYDLVELFVDSSFVDFAIYDIGSEMELYNGPADEIDEELIDLDIMSIDCPQPNTPFTVNVDTNEGLF